MNVEPLLVHIKSVFEVNPIVREYDKIRKRTVSVAIIPNICLL